MVYLGPLRIPHLVTGIIRESKKTPGQFFITLNRDQDALMTDEERTEALKRIRREWDARRQ